MDPDLDEDFHREASPIGGVITFDDDDDVGNDTDENGFHSNVTQSYCEDLFSKEIEELSNSSSDGFCNVTTDKLMCWPPTPVDQTVYVQCFSELNSIKYDATREYSFFFSV